MSIPPEDSSPTPEPPARRRSLRSLDDLTGRLSGEPDPPVPKPGAPPLEQPAAPAPEQPPDLDPDRKERMGRALSLLSSWGEEEGEPSPEPAPPPAESTRSARLNKGRAALDALFADRSDETITPQSSAKPGQSQPSEFSENGSESLGVKIPPELEAYLSPEMWRKLNSPNLRRGVLISALDRLRSIQYLLSTFLPGHLVQEKLRRPVPGLVSGQVLTGSLLFSDVSGFTAMSERLADLGPEGAERLTRTMNRYFTTMLEILSWSGGILIKFAGDAMLVYFPEQEGGVQALWAVRAGSRMLRAMSQFENLEVPGGNVSLRMKIGIASGEYLAASIGSASRMEYAVLGPAVTRTMGAEGASTGPGQLIVDQETIGLLGNTYGCTQQAPGYFLIAQNDEDLDDFEIRAEQRRPRSAIPWSASPQAIVGQMQVTVRQVQALLPYLAPELSERVMVHAQQRQVDSEFRPTIIMFMNFTGPENLLDRWGPAGAQRITTILGAYFNAMHEVIARYGGIVSRIDPYSKGTKMLVLFGAPVSHEDDPQRAVSSALAMNLELEQLNERLHQKLARHLPEDFTDPLVQHRIGITYGTTFAGQVGSQTRREYTVMGDDVNLAARLMGAGKPGQILVSPSVYDAVKDLFIFTHPPPIRVKGKSKPIAISQVDGPRDRSLEPRIKARGPLIGRQAELRRCEQVLERALAGRPALLILQGPPGIGKSHLADALLLQAQAVQAHLLATQCQSYQAATPYAAWGNVLRTLAGITVLDLPQAYPEKLERFTSSLQLEAGVAASLGTLMGLVQVDSASLPEGETQSAAGQQTASEESFIDGLKQGRARRRSSGLDFLQQLDQPKSAEAGAAWQAIPAALKGQERRNVYGHVVNLLEKLQERFPLVLFFEDAHWLDPASLDLLRYVLNHLEQARLLVLLAQRPKEEDESLQGTLLELKPLDLQGTHDLVADILVSELAKMIHGQSGGYPLLVEEITRWIQRSRKMSPDDMREILQSSDVLQKLVLSNLETLPEMQREVARLTSVIGTEFRVGELQALLGSEVDPVSLSSHLRGLVAAQVFNMSEGGVDARYEFQQSLVRDILYNSLPFDRRRELHRLLADYLNAPQKDRTAVHNRIAAFLEARRELSPAEQSELVASHYERADAFLPAARHLLTAAQHARTNQSYDRAAALYQRGLNCLDKARDLANESELSPLNTRLLIGSGDMALRAGDYPAALSAYDRARLALPPDLSQQAVTQFYTNLALVLPTQGRAAEAVPVLETAVEGLQSSTLPEDASAAGPDIRLAALAALAWLNWRTASPLAAGWIEMGRQQVASCSGPWVKKIKALLNDLAGDEEAAAEAYLSLSLPTGAALLAVRQGDHLLESHEIDQAPLRYRQAVELWSGRKKDPTGLFLANFRLAQAAWLRGATRIAAAALNEAQAQLPEAMPVLRPEAQKAVKAASRVLDGKVKKWPEFSGQAYDDVFRINLLFRI